MDGVVVLARALGDPTRVRVLLGLALEGSSVGDVARRLGVTVATVSHHLAVLLDAGLVTFTARGRQHIYRRLPREVVLVTTAA
jgi:DNA-binding transcriptional ArsR family regulator